VLLERPIRAERGEVRYTARRAELAGRIPWIAAFVTLVLHLAGNAHYGFFRDELYFIVCGFHPALGYVDQPPLTPLLAAFSQTFGTSLFALRAIPAICAAIATYGACLVAAELGGGIFALVLTGLITMFSPQMLAFGARLSPDSLQMCTWVIAALWVLRIVRGADERMWLAVGALVAFSGWAKYTVAFFGAALIVGLLLTPERRVLKTPWFFAGMALCGLLMVPNVWWQWHYHWPMLQLLQNDEGKFLLTNPPFVVQQIMNMSPLLSIVWLTGLWYVFYRPQLRFLGYCYVALILVMWYLQAKAYYPGAIYPYLIAAGTVPIERWTQGARVWRKVFVALVVLLAIPSTPFVLPMVPLPTYVKYQEVLGNLFHINFHTEKNAGNDVPIQYYADMTGWPEIAQSVAQVYAALPPADRARAAIYTHNFGEAAAIDLYGPRYLLPPALSGNDNYWIWGPRGYDGSVVIDVNGPELARLGGYRSVRRATIVHTRYAMPYENDLTVDVLRDPLHPLPEIWPKLKNFSYAFNGL
jgi:hypothetical protein